MRVVDDPDLAAWFSHAEAEAFAVRLGVRVERPNLAALTALIRAYLGRIPFQNVSMLARYGRAPSASEILEDMRRGRGGPCNVMNPFLAALLARLGYDVGLVCGWMRAPDGHHRGLAPSHIALSVRLEGRVHWLDAGNGHPYLEPVALGDEAPRSHAGLTFRLATRAAPAEAYAVEHLSQEETAWRTSYVFTPVRRPLRFFAQMIEQHHTEPGFGPFLTGLRIIRFPDGALTAIRDDVVLTGRTQVLKARLGDRRALLDAVTEHFGDIDLPVDDALRALERAGHPLFDAPPPSPGGPHDPHLRPASS